MSTTGPRFPSSRRVGPRLPTGLPSVRGTLGPTVGASLVSVRPRSDRPCPTRSFQPLVYQPSSRPHPHLTPGSGLKDENTGPRVGDEWDERRDANRRTVQVGSSLPRRPHPLPRSEDGPEDDRTRRGTPRSRTYVWEGTWGRGRSGPVRPDQGQRRPPGRTETTTGERVTGGRHRRQTRSEGRGRHRRQTRRSDGRDEKVPKGVEVLVEGFRLGLAPPRTKGYYFPLPPTSVQSPCPTPTSYAPESSVPPPYPQTQTLSPRYLPHSVLPAPRSHVALGSVLPVPSPTPTTTPLWSLRVLRLL